MVPVPNVGAQALYVPSRRCLDIAIPQKRESVLVSVYVVVVLPAWCLDRLEEVYRLVMYESACVGRGVGQIRRSADRL